MRHLFCYVVSNTICTTSEQLGVDVLFSGKIIWSKQKLDKPRLREQRGRDMDAACGSNGGIRLLISCEQ